MESMETTETPLVEADSAERKRKFVGKSHEQFLSKSLSWEKSKENSDSHEANYTQSREFLVDYTHHSIRKKEIGRSAGSHRPMR